MKLTTAILAAVTTMTGGAWAQNPNIIGNVQNNVTTVQQQQTAASNAALGIQATPGTAPAQKPTAGAPSPAVKPAPVAKTSPSASNAASAPAKATTAKPAIAAASSPENKLERVNVNHHGDDVEIEIGMREAVKPNVLKLTSPDRVVVQLPGTAMATTQNKIAVGSSGIKGIRIGENSKTPPTTSVVVDLEHAFTYDVSSASSDKFVLTVHGQGAAAKATAQAAPKSVAPVTAKAAPQVAVKTAPQVANAAPQVVTKTVPQVAVKSAPASVKPTPQVAAKSAASPAPVKAEQTKTAAAKPVVTSTIAVTKPAVVVAPPAVKGAPTVGKAAPVVAIAAAPKPTTASTTKATAPAPVTAKSGIVATPGATSKGAVTAAANQPLANAAETKPGDDKVAPIGASADASTPKPEDKKWAMTGKRDPFFSPVVQQTSGSGCSTGKKCLEIAQINVRGIVKSQDGFIAVVTNSLNKAYFLHENDPVFNGYVLHITGDTVVFQETYQDKLGKPMTREITKRVTAPAV
jgi:hypothetical protein